MGCGAMKRQHGKAFEVDTSIEAPAGSEARREFRKLEEELLWLRKVFEKEKSEKKWIMERYERVESDLIARTQEAEQLRSQVEAIRATGPVNVAAASSASTMQASAPQPVVLQASAPQPVVLQSSVSAPPVQVTTSPTADRPSSPAGEAPISPGGTSLKARRGLQLSVVTNSKVTAKPAADVQVAQPAPTLQAPRLQPLEKVQAQPQAPVQLAVGSSNGNHVVEFLDTPEIRTLTPSPSMTSIQSVSKKDEFLANLAAKSKMNQDDGELVEPMTAKARLGRSTWGAQFEEEDVPMSPLLRRRRNDFPTDGAVGGVRNKKNPARFVTSPAACTSPKGLMVSAMKVDKLDLVPPSPKRIPPTPGKRKARQDAEWAAPIAESMEETEASMGAVQTSHF